MTLLDGWVGELVADDPEAAPTLVALAADEEQPNKSKKKKEKKGKKKEKAAAAGSKSSSKSLAQNESSGLIVKLVAAVLVMVGLGFGGLKAWPYISEYLAAEDRPPLPTNQEPTQALVIEDNTLYLEGSVPDDQISEQFEGTMTEAVGSDRVVNNLEISDDAVFDPSQPVELKVAETVLFSTGSTDIGERYRPLVGLAVELLASNEDSTILIVGHTDDIGEERVNLELSVGRAEATAFEITSRGIEESRVTTEGRGESDPMASNDTDDGRTANRRVEFLVDGLFD